MDERDEREQTSGDASKRLQTASKLELHHCSRKSVAGTYLLATRCPVYRRHDSHSGFRTELENLSNDAKGKGTSSEPARPKVPMRRAGADCSVIARKRGNARGAKGAGHRRWERANWQQEEPSFLDGRRRSSLGGTSRMMQEYHVRICERLGVKLPGPTRRFAPAQRRGEAQCSDLSGLPTETHDVHFAWYSTRVKPLNHPFAGRAGRARTATGASASYGERESRDNHAQGNPGG